MDSISVVILSYRRPRLLNLALQSLIEQERRPGEILVIDNRSDESEKIAAVVHTFPGTTLIQNDRNLGFSRSINLAAERATGRFLYVGVDDLVLHPKCLGEMAAFLEGQSRPHVVSGLLYRERSGIIQCAGGNMVMDANFQLEFLGAGQKTLPQGSSPFEVTYVPGGFILLERSVYRRIGGYRSAFFMYHEDTELSARARRLGCTLTVVPSAVAYDMIASHTGPAVRIGVSKVTNFLSLYVLHAEAGVLAAFAFKQVFFTPLILLFSSPKQAAQWITALVLVVIRLPGLLRDRRALSAAVKAGLNTRSSAAPLTGVPSAL